MQKENLSTLINEIKDDITAGMKKYNIPGMSVALISKDGIVWAEGFGFIDRNKTREVDSNTLFWIGSLAKAYTATAFLLAVQDGLVSLDDPLIEYYPEFNWNTKFGDKEREKITLRHLLTHRSGLQHFTQTTEPGAEELFSFEKYISKINDSWQKFPVGERHSYSYSNAGYDLIPFVLQRITGMKFSDYVKKKIYEPLGMSRSIIGTVNVLGNANWAKGHENDSEFDSAKFISPSIGAAGHYSSLNDMSKFVKMHLNNGIVDGKEFLKQELLEEVYTIPFAEEHELSTIGMGLGVVKNKYEGRLMLTFFGDGDGCFCGHRFIPELGIGLLLECNQIVDTMPFIVEIAEKIMSGLVKERLGEVPEDVTINDKVQLPPPTELEIEKLERLQGKYISRMMMDINIELEDQNLIFNYKGEEINLESHSENIFSTKVFPIIEFLKDEDGRPVKLKAIDSTGRIAILDYDSGPLNEKGPNKEEWKKFSNLYRFDFSSFCFYSYAIIKNGYLHLLTTMGSKDFRLNEFRDNVFFTADGQDVVFEKDRMSMPSSIWVKDDLDVENIIKLTEESPSDIRTNKQSLRELEEILRWIGKETEADKISSLIVD
ncbi:MAG: serine hydrolase domain-containing protein [Candidatus Heimdallarchaeaceae archaeon]